MTTAHQETLRLGSASGWFGNYKSVLTGVVSETSRDVILSDAARIAAAVAPTIEDPAWGNGRILTSAVMGAVQSGKTASMVGLVAKAIDNGVNVVVILGGTQTALWLQTLERIHKQLDVMQFPIRHRLFVPNPITALLPDARLGASAAYNMSDRVVQKTLTSGKPIVVVALKEPNHLGRLSETLHSTVFPAAEHAGVALRMLVLDDEADDSSVSGDGPTHSKFDFKQIPKRIQDLWQSRQRSGTTASTGIFSSYVAYTATPQANFLQDPKNPLYPRHFVAALRTPGRTGSPNGKELTYRVPEGISGWYTGSDTYYRQFADILCVIDDDALGGEEDADIAESEAAAFDEMINAVRSHLVASAIRIFRSGARYGPHSARSVIFDSRADAAAECSPPISMLIHPASSMATHFETRDALLNWWRGDGTVDAHQGVLRDLDVNRDSWLRWHESFKKSASMIGTQTDSSSLREVPDWRTIEDIITTEVIPGTGIDVVNSHQESDARPDFSVREESGTWRAPRNHSTIFISGNVMARGLTLEGLLTTIFTRSTKSPLADSQMQMQRWFGYRGTYIDLCRVFLTRYQFDLFCAYADADLALRTQILNQSDTGLEDGELFTVLQGSDFNATGKIADLYSRTLSPGHTPAVRILNPPSADAANLEVIGKHFECAAKKGSLIAESRGMLDKVPLSLSDAADLLDSLEYSEYTVSPAERERWAALRRLIGAPVQLLRAPQNEHAKPTVEELPYSLAAYLRLWSHCIDLDVPGLMTASEPPTSWNLVDPENRRRSQPRFRVALRFGRGAPASDPSLQSLAAVAGVSVTAMARGFRNDKLGTSWGSRGLKDGHYRGDDLFDYNLTGEEPRVTSDGIRLQGSDGLILFQLIQRDEGLVSVAIGMSIPMGGPDYVEATTSQRTKL